MRRLFFLCGLLFSLTLTGQHVKQIPVGFQPISQATIDLAAADLSAASAASIYDVKMIFVTKLEGVTDRYQVYDGFGNDYLGFFNTPLDGSSGDADDPAMVHQQLLAAGQAELGNLGDYSMFIIYTTILDITNTNLSYDQKKHVLYGANMSGCHKRRFEQIEEFGSKPTDYCVNNTIATNDTYVSWYTDKLVEATSPEYVVTGTISFQNEIFCSEETLYINDPHNGEIQNNSDFHPPIVLLVHPEMNVGTITWSSPTTSATLFTSNTGAYNTLNFPREAFEQFNTLVASWGGKQSSMRVLPVNFQVVVDEDTLSQQGNAIGEITFVYKNNHANFPVENDIIVEVVGPTNVEGAPDEETVLPTATGMEFKWTPDEEECDPYNIDHILLANNRNLTEHSKTTPFELKCAFTMIDFVVSAPHTMTSKVSGGNPSLNIRSASDEAGETLYIVSNHPNSNEDLLRDIRAKIIWEDLEAPEPDDYWKQTPSVTGLYEPIWFGTPPGFTISLLGNEKEHDITEEFEPESFNTPPVSIIDSLSAPPTTAASVFNHFFPGTEEKSGRVKVIAFEQEREVPLKFQHRHFRKVVDDDKELPPVMAQNVYTVVTNILDYVDIVDSLLPIDIPDIPIDLELGSTVYSEELPASPLYQNVINSSLSGLFSFNLPTSGDYLILGPQLPPNGLIDGGFGLGAKVTIGIGASMYFKRVKTNNVPVSGNYQDMVYDWGGEGITITISGKAGLVGQASIGSSISLDAGGVGDLNISLSPITIYQNPSSDWEMKIPITVDPIPLYGYFDLSIDLFGWEWNPFGDGGAQTDPVYTVLPNGYFSEQIIPLSW